MPIVTLKFKGGKIETDYEGFPGNSCDQEELSILEKLQKAGLAVESISEERKDEEQFEEETEYA